MKSAGAARMAAIGWIDLLAAHWASEALGYA